MLAPARMPLNVGESFAPILECFLIYIPILCFISYIVAHNSNLELQHRCLDLLRHWRSSTPGMETERVPAMGALFRPW